MNLFRVSLSIGRGGDLSDLVQSFALNLAVYRALRYRLSKTVTDSLPRS